MPLAPCSRPARPTAVQTASQRPVGDDETVLRRTLGVLILGALMSSVDATVTNIALHSIGRDFDSRVATTQWVISAYVLTLAAVIPASGWTAQRFGARTVYATALAVFAVSSALCATATSLPELVLYRALQGIAGGLLLPIAQLIAAQVGGPSRMGQTSSRIWMASSFGAILGPSLGGLLITALSWRWIFLINVPIGGLAALAALRMLPVTPRSRPGRLDIAGLLRLSVALPALLFALEHAALSGGLASATTLIPLLCGLALMLDFARHSSRARHPLLDLELLRRRLFATGALCLVLTNISWSALLVLEPLFLQQVRNMTPALAGALIAPQGAGTVLSMWIAGRIHGGARAARVACGGFLIVAGTTLLIGALGRTVGDWAIGLLLFTGGIAGGHAWVAATGSSYADVSANDIPHASPLLTSISRVGQALGVAFGALVLQAKLDVTSAIAPAGQVAGAFRGSFEDVAVVAILCAGAFLALARYATTRAGQTAARTATGTDRARPADA
jgi:EmrB/QacA subfamily drug resistance transporter